MNGRALLRPVAWMAVLAAAAVSVRGKGPASRPREQDLRPIARIIYGKGRELARLANKAIDESSGLACGRANEGVFWTHNDSGDRPRVFAFSAKGEDLATVSLSGARARDWEDMASFTAGGRHILLLADVGDNDRKRKTCTLYAIVEPKLDPPRRGVRRVAAVAETIVFRYEDGPHNCESVAVDPTTRTIYLVSKELWGGCKVYALRWPDRPGKRPRPLVARAVASLAIPTTTAMDISPDGLRAVVLTYGPAYEFVRRPGQTWAKGFSRKPRRLSMPRRAQGESICYGPDGKVLYLTSESRRRSKPSPLLEVPVVKDIPASATRPATPAG